MYKSTYLQNKQTHRDRKQANAYQRGRRMRSLGLQIQVTIYKKKQQGLLYRRESYIQCLV